MPLSHFPGDTRRRTLGFVRGKPLLWLTVLAFTSVASASELAPPRGFSERLVRIHDGLHRHALAWRPSEDFVPGRLLIMLHGAGGDAARIRRFTAYGLERNASAGRWLVVYPEGVEGTWNDCRRNIEYPARRLDIDDVGFLATLIEDLMARYGLRASDVLVAGFSNGGQMALRLALERPELLDGLALVGAQLPVAAESLCAQPLPPLHFLHIAGTWDPLLPFDGGPSAGVRGEPLGLVESAAATANAFVTAAGGGRSDRLELPERDGDPVTSASLREWQTPGPIIRQYVLEGAGHVIPQRETPFPPVVGPSAGDIEFATVLLEFMALWESAE